MNFRSMPCRAVRAFTLFVLFSASACSGSFAQGTPQERSDCMGDAFQFCAGDIPNVEAIEACLKTNLNSLSPACRSEFEPQARSKLRRDHFS